MWGYRAKAQGVGDEILHASMYPDLLKAFPKSIIENVQLENILSLNSPIIPNEYNIEKIYPNPFNPVINIEYEISKLSFISAKIFNLRGQLIDILYSGYKKPGNYSITWDGSLQPSGMYLFVLNNNSSVLSQKIMLIKWFLLHPVIFVLFNIEWFLV